MYVQVLDWYSDMVSLVDASNDTIQKGGHEEMGEDYDGIQFTLLGRFFATTVISMFVYRSIRDWF
jgi:hypothetical protein